MKGLLIAVVLIFSPISALSHDAEASVSAQVETWLQSLGALKSSAAFQYEDRARTAFKWVPGLRAGVRLDSLDERQRHELRDILRALLSRDGAIKIDAIIATEAALAVIERAPEYRNPGKYYSAVFGTPGSDKWMLRFEGHHLSVNLSFRQDTLVSASPLFLGVNPETVTSGPDKGLRAMAQEVDLARALYRSLNSKQQEQAGDSEEWFSGFLTDAGSRRANLGAPSGISALELNPDQALILKNLIESYVGTIHDGFSHAYLEQLWQSEWRALRFYWRGSSAQGDDYYYRISGDRLLIEHETQSGDSHIHAVWRDAKLDFDL
jgi:hypothetical protein